MNVYLNGEVGWELTLESVTKKFEGKKVENVYINSIGGDVWEGIAIYNFLKEKNVTTITNGVVASIASIMFLAGKKRIINQYDDFLIHCPFSMGMGTAEDLEKAAKETKKIENKLAKIYEAETNLSFDEAIEEMKKDEFTNPDWLIENGFVNEIKEFKAVATIKNKNMSNKQELSEKDKNWFESMFAKFVNKKPEQSEGASAKLVQDANGLEIDFYELDEEATPKIGDKAKIEDKAAEGDYTLPNGDVWMFEGGELADIVKEEGDDLEKENEDLKADVEAKELELTEATAKIEKAEKDLLDFQEEFATFKSEIKTKFDWDGKEAKPEPQKRNKLK